MSVVTQANIRIDQGAEFETIFIIEDSNSDRVNLTDYNLFGQIRKTYTSSKFWSFDFNLLNAEEGELIVRLPSSRSIDIKPGRYMYDIYGEFIVEGVEWPDESAIFYKFVEGIADVVPRVTKIEENG